jgi:alkylation response protein AidB-like acyl-CoA dehydrogenase
MNVLYSPPLAQSRFLLERVHDLSGLLEGVGGDLDTATCWVILESAARFAVEVLSPLNQIGDRHGCKLDGDHVVMPPGFARAYAIFVEQGWPSLSAPRRFGRQEAPLLLQLAVSEMVIGACMSFAMLPLQERAAITVLKHVDQELYAPLITDLAAGRCGATIAMTEANAGSDAGRCRTRAIERPDGRYELYGTKVFISYADHDLTDRIVHLVLAREAADQVSLFLVGKWLDERCAERNSAYVTAIEAKMGLKASPTCVLSLDGAIGERIGPLGKGLATIFKMVNTMRLEVAMHGVAIGHAAYARARSYADERVQGDDSSGKGPVALIEHPDVRRNLLGIRARVEGMRALIFEVARRLDLAERLPHAKANESRLLAEFLLPVCKAAGSEAGFEAANIALQIFGGYGYVAGTGLEQLVRDIRVSSIFEGTTGIQAIDILTRKLAGDNMRRWQVFVGIVNAELETMAGQPHVQELTQAIDALQLAAEALVGRLHCDRDRALAGATPFLQAVAVTALGWTWLRLRSAGVVAALPDPKFGDVVAFFFQNILPMYRLYLHQALQGV